MGFRTLTNICFSGGAEGADTMWGDNATKFGYDVVHFSFIGHKTSHSVIRLTEKELSEADELLKLANKRLKRNYPSRSQYVNNLLRRNFYQIKFSNACYAIAPIVANQVQGGTAWATEMFSLTRNGPVYVFDETQNAWFQRFGDIFEKCDIPTSPTVDFTGIGSRNVSKLAENAIIDVFNNR